MLISIVTPSYRRPDFLADTVESVIHQKGGFELEYIIQDGGGCDRTKKLLEKLQLESRLTPNAARRRMTVYSEPDDGMYAAINRGFSRASGDILAWLNSDDMYHPFALDTVCRIFSQHPSVMWITGIPNSYNQEGARTGFDAFPNAYSRPFVEAGYYDVKFLQYGFNWIQQESTFWRRELWEQAGPLNESLRYAADFFLWRSFAKYTDLVKVYSFLGGFRVHGNQFTADASRYRTELPQVEPPAGLRDFVKLVKSDPSAKARYLGVDEESQQRLQQRFGLRRPQLCGRTIRWRHHENSWRLQWELIV